MYLLTDCFKITDFELNTNGFSIYDSKFEIIILLEKGRIRFRDSDVHMINLISFFKYFDSSERT